MLNYEFLVILLYGGIVSGVKLKQKFVYDVTSDFKLFEGPIYAKGWLKYTNYTPESGVKPNVFEKNKQFIGQFKNDTIDVSKTDKVGYINIPDDEHFFFILSEGGVNIVSSRKVYFVII
jgi:hypothetical protein